MSFILNWGFKYISQRGQVFRENKWNKWGTEDPYYDTYEIEQNSFFGGPSKKKKTIKKPKKIPEGLSSNDERVLKQVMRRAYHLDMLFNVFGYQIGWSGIVGILPVVGDVTGVVFSLLMFKTAREVDGGLPWEVQIYFLINIVVDFVLGLVPIVGDLVEVMYKANSRNALVLEKHLEQKGLMALAKSGVGITYNDPSSISTAKSTSSLTFSEGTSFQEDEIVREAARKQHEMNQRELEMKIMSAGKDSSGMQGRLRAKGSPLNM